MHTYVTFRFHRSGRNRPWEHCRAANATGCCWPGCSHAQPTFWSLTNRQTISTSKLSGDPVRDRDKINACRDLNDTERLRVRVDANNLWTDPETAARHLTSLDFSFVGIEEPLQANALDGMRIVSEQTGCRIILDESVLRTEQLAAIVADPKRWIINVRVSKMGGLLRSLAFVKDARASGISTIVGAQVGETSVLTRAGLIVARAAGDNLIAQEGAFGTHLLEADVATPPLMFGPSGVLNADSHSLSTRAGWGVALTT